MIHIVIRKTVDWNDERAVTEQLPLHLFPYVQLWNETFQLPYHRYRERLKQIARANLESVEGAEICSWDEVPDGGVVLSVDDDDWFRPDVAQRLTNLVDHERYFGYRWPARFLEVHFNRLHPLSAWGQLWIPGLWPPKHFCATNNYAFVKGPELRHCLDSHVAASQTFLAEPARVCRVREHLSLMNRSLGSTTTFLAGMRNPERSVLLDRYRKYCALYRRPPRGRLAWAAPQVEAMSSLMSELLD